MSFTDFAPSTPRDPAFSGAAVTPHDTNPLLNYSKPVRALWVGGAGNVVVRLKNASADVTLVGVPAGTLLPVMATHVRSTNTTATSIVALW